MDRRDDTGELAWPGFVDILSAVIMMFVFFVMITAIVMYVLSVEHQKAVSDKNEERVAEMVSAEMKELIEKIREEEITLEDLENRNQYKENVKTLENENNRLTKDSLKLTHEVDSLSGTLEQIKADFARDLDQSTKVTEGYFTILFSHNDISLSPETVDTINSYIEGRIKQIGSRDVQVSILSCDNPNSPTITVSRELGLARSLNLRNTVLESNIDPSNISVKFVEGDAIDDSYNWVKIGIQPR